MLIWCMAFQPILDELGGSKFLEGWEAYADDVVVELKDNVSAADALTDIDEILAKRGLTLSKEKCQF